LKDLKSQSLPDISEQEIRRVRATHRKLSASVSVVQLLYGWKILTKRIIVSLCCTHTIYVAFMSL